ncbi:carbamoyltransferase HypF [Halomonas faecis]|uniref:carbamoyltransferase HypF n=1 Tax=Halomonas faecis TaxID=1562110 RepID=UPI0013D3D235|nr:carbamoyltransferase HypF [Halomonas faecis]
MIVLDKCSPLTVQRLAVRVRGQVQGVGFRPFVHGLAGRLGLVGWVRNDAAGVELEVQGTDAALETFLAGLEHERPPLARLESVTQAPREPCDDEEGFRIVASSQGAVSTGITPDAAVCRQCLDELFDPADRRYRYPFINCTHCGPRYTLTARLPYDRPHTSMAAFALCPRCAAEYRDPAHRRFHAQPNACAECGPRLAFHAADGRRETRCDPLAATAEALREGMIVAVKGIGGFHLCCDARNPRAVARLRERKRRDEKPLAVMAVNVRSLAPLATVSPGEAELLEAWQRPIVLLNKRADCDRRLPGIAPGLGRLGAMLPYTPLHYLLLHELVGRPAGTAWLDARQDALLVCTSANLAGDPLVHDNAAALQRLAGIADAFLMHDRDILVRCDDSVVRCAAGTGEVDGHDAAAFIRRARGYTPSAIGLSRAGPSVLATGGELKSALCLTRDSQAFLSQHIGDLDHAETCRTLEESADHLCRVLAVRPEALACDLHPDFFSTHLAARLAETWDVPLFTVQHHHAHLAAVQAEYGLEGPLLGLALDGVGLGTDGTAWGGELLRLEGAAFSRLGHLHPLPLPGGDRAAREPWRMGAAALQALGQGERIAGYFADRPQVEGLAMLLARGVRCPTTTSLGRLFDAAAGLLRIKPVARYEGQAAMLLEGLAEAHGEVADQPDGWTLRDGVLDFRPLLGTLLDEPSAARGAARFHATLAAGLAEWVWHQARSDGLQDVLLGGGCCVNQVLTTALERRLRNAGLRVWQAQQAPPNDGGLSLGQAWVALQALQDGSPCGVNDDSE